MHWAIELGATAQVWGAMWSDRGGAMSGAVLVAEVCMKLVSSDGLGIGIVLILNDIKSRKVIVQEFNDNMTGKEE